MAGHNRRKSLIIANCCLYIYIGNGCWPNSFDMFWIDWWIELESESMWMILAYHDHRWIQTLTLWPATVGPTGLSILHEKNADMLYRLYILPLVVWHLAICARAVLIAMLSLSWNKPMETSRDACRFIFAYSCLPSIPTKKAQLKKTWKNAMSTSFGIFEV